MSQKRVPPTPSKPSSNPPVFQVAPPNKLEIVESIALISQAVGAFYGGLVDSGVPADVARELTRDFVATLPEMFRNVS